MGTAKTPAVNGFRFTQEDPRTGATVTITIDYGAGFADGHQFGLIDADRVKRAKQQQRRHRRRMAFARIIHRVKP